MTWAIFTVQFLVRIYLYKVPNVFVAQIFSAQKVVSNVCD